uniref:Uncharacterized protein n=1 Tax=Oryza barthii TaxID=65489 RepID=A0A0D3GI64_9ORYZ
MPLAAARAAANQNIGRRKRSAPGHERAPPLMPASVMGWPATAVCAARVLAGAPPSSRVGCRASWAG